MSQPIIPRALTVLKGCKQIYKEHIPQGWGGGHPYVEIRDMSEFGAYFLRVMVQNFRVLFSILQYFSSFLHKLNNYQKVLKRCQNITEIFIKITANRWKTIKNSNNRENISSKLLTTLRNTENEPHGQEDC